MSRKLDFTKHIVSYLCPSCSFRINRDILYPDPKIYVSEEHSIIISTWCDKCEAIHEYEVTINSLKKGGYRISTKYFLLNHERFNRRLRLKASH